MKTVILSLVILGILVGCSDEKYDSGPSFPSSPETQARQRFTQSGVVDAYRAEGLSLSCERVCLDVTSEDIALLKEKVSSFVPTKLKIKKIELEKREQVGFSSSSEPTLYLPIPVKAELLEQISNVFTEVNLFEAKSTKKIFINGTTPNYIPALKVLTQRADDIPADFKKIRLVEGSTNVSRISLEAEINVDNVPAHFDREMSRLNLFMSAYKKMPTVAISISYEIGDEAYDYIPILIAHADEIKAIIGKKRFWFFINNRDHEFYMSAEGILIGNGIDVYTRWSISKLLAILKYEVYISGLRKTITRNIFHEDYSSSDEKFTECFKKLPELEADLKNRADQNIIIDYGFLNRGASSRWDDMGVHLTCYKDTVEQMRAVLQRGPNTPANK